LRIGDGGGALLNAENSHIKVAVVGPFEN